MTSTSQALEVIRRAESEAAGRVEAARMSADERLARAHADARSTVASARTEGLAEADERYASTVADAEAMAESITADDRVARLGRSVEARMGDLVEAMMVLVLSAPEERGA